MEFGSHETRKEKRDAGNPQISQSRNRRKSLASWFPDFGRKYLLLSWLPGFHVRRRYLLVSWLPASRFDENTSWFPGFLLPNPLFRSWFPRRKSACNRSRLLLLSRPTLTRV